MRSIRRRSPTLASVEEEAAGFRRESKILRDELASLRVDIASTLVELHAFSGMLDDHQGVK